MTEPAPHYTGHRARLRERFLDKGSDGLADYELLELILFAATPRGDVKPLAKTLIKTTPNLPRFDPHPPKTKLQYTLHTIEKPCGRPDNDTR